jgi:hypothetical protein
MLSKDHLMLMEALEPLEVLLAGTTLPFQLGTRSLLVVVEALNEAAGVTAPGVAAKSLVIDPTATELAHSVIVVSTADERRTDV